MNGDTKLLAFAGSTRSESHNQKLMRLVAKAAESAGAEVTMLALADLALPLYDGDLEQADGIPEGGLRLKAAIAGHDGLLIASPEYNGGLSAVLKNALDWASRRDGDEPALASYKGKVAAIIGASPGRLGGARGLIALRQVLTSCGVLVIPTQFALAEAHKAFDGAGELTNPAHRATVDNIAKSLVETADRLKA